MVLAKYGLAVSRGYHRCRERKEKTDEIIQRQYAVAIREQTVPLRFTLSYGLSSYLPRVQSTAFHQGGITGIDLGPYRSQPLATSDHNVGDRVIRWSLISWKGVRGNRLVVFAINRKCL